MSMGDRLILARKKRKWTASELASASVVHQSVIHYIEAGSRDPDKVEVGTIRKLAQALGVTTDYLIGMHDEDDRHAT
jgi:transcriptional regulator with XRE-family HTH domain